MLIKPIGGSGVVIKEGDGYKLPDVLLDDASGNQVALAINYETDKAAGNDTGLQINMTDTGSPGISYLIDAQVGGVSKFSVDNAGDLTANNIYTGMLTSGDVKGFQFRASHSNDSFTGWTENFPITLQHRGFSTDDKIAVSIATGTFSNENGYAIPVALLPTYNQTTSGSSDNTDFLINRTETSVSSGVQALIDAQVGGVSKFSVDDLGRVVNAITLSTSAENTIGLEIATTYSASGDTTSTDLLINRTENLISTGEQLLFSTQVGGVRKFKIFTNGDIMFGANGNINDVKMDSTAQRFNLSFGNGSSRLHIDQVDASIALTNSWGLNWSSSSSSGGTVDTGIARISAGSLKITDGSTGLGDLSCNIAIPKSYTVATTPSPSGVTGGMIYVTDETGGAVPAFSDGIDWLRITDRAVVTT